MIAMEFEWLPCYTVADLFWSHDPKLSDSIFDLMV